MAIDIGLIGYNTYAKELNREVSKDQELPQWSELGKPMQDAWRSAAIAILQYIDVGLKRMANGETIE